MIDLIHIVLILLYVFLVSVQYQLYWHKKHIIYLYTCNTYIYIYVYILCVCICIYIQYNMTCTDTRNEHNKTNTIKVSLTITDINRSTFFVLWVVNIRSKYTRALTDILFCLSFRQRNRSTSSAISCSDTLSSATPSRWKLSTDSQKSVYFVLIFTLIFICLFFFGLWQRSAVENPQKKSVYSGFLE